jgi:hypothetical protein
VDKQTLDNGASKQNTKALAKFILSPWFITGSRQAVVNVVVSPSSVSFFFCCDDRIHSFYARSRFGLVLGRAWRRGSVSRPWRRRGWGRSTKTLGRRLGDWGSDSCVLAAALGKKVL